MISGYINTDNAKSNMAAKIKKLILGFVGVVLTTSAGISIAQETPLTPPIGIRVVEAKDIPGLVERGAILVDARKTVEYVDGTIKGAISVPYDPERSIKDVSFDPREDKINLGKIPDKLKDYIVFCNAGSCWRSYKAVVVMMNEGYRNVYWYRGGIPDWKAKKLPIESQRPQIDSNFGR